MKKTILFVILLSLCGRIAAQQALFDKYEDEKGVRTVYVSKAMLGMINAMRSRNSKIDDIDFEKLASKVDQLRILYSEVEAKWKKIAKEAAEYYKKKKYEEMMHMKDESDIAIIYMKKGEDGKNEYILFRTGGTEGDIINVVGSLTTDDLEDILNCLAGNRKKVRVRKIEDTSLLFLVKPILNASLFATLTSAFILSAAIN